MTLKSRTRVCAGEGSISVRLRQGDQYPHVFVQIKMKTLMVWFWLLSLSCAALAQSSSCDLMSAKDLPADRQKRFEQLLNSGTADQAAVHFDRALAYAKIGNYRAALA